MNEQSRIAVGENGQGKDENADQCRTEKKVGENDDSQVQEVAEQWRPVVGYEGLYEVSNIGRVRSIDRVVFHGRNGMRKIRGIFIKQQPHKNGYLCCPISRNGNAFLRLTHRLVCLAFIPKEEGRNLVNHRDGVKTNNCSTNLEWSTQLENIIHALNTGLRNPYLEKRPVGELNHRAILTEAIVMKMRTMADAGNRISEIAHILGFSWQTTKNAVRKITWNHLP